MCKRNLVLLLKSEISIYVRNFKQILKNENVIVIRFHFLIPFLGLNPRSLDRMNSTFFVYP
jgi:hypothetical protein